MCTSPRPAIKKKYFPFFIIFIRSTPDFILGSCYTMILFTPKTIVSFVCLFVVLCSAKIRKKLLEQPHIPNFMISCNSMSTWKKKKTIFNSFISTSTPAEKKENDVKELTLNLMMIKVYIWYCVRVCHVLYMSYLLQKKNKSWFIKIWNIKINLLFHIIQFHAKPKSLILCRCNINLIICWRMV